MKRSVLVTWLRLEPSADFSTFLITTSPAPAPARPFCARSSLCCRSSCRRVSRSFSLWSEVEERRGEEEGKVERWCQWKKRRRRTGDPKQTPSTSSDCHKDGLKQGFQIWGDTFQHSFHSNVQLSWTQKHLQLGGSRLKLKLTSNTYCTDKESKHTPIVPCRRPRSVMSRS